MKKLDYFISLIIGALLPYIFLVLLDLIIENQFNVLAFFIYWDIIFILLIFVAPEVQKS